MRLTLQPLSRAFDPTVAQQNEWNCKPNKLTTRLLDPMRFCEGLGFATEGTPPRPDSRTDAGGPKMHHRGYSLKPGQAAVPDTAMAQATSLTQRKLWPGLAHTEQRRKQKPQTQTRQLHVAP